jgi:hypothetical protein
MRWNAVAVISRLLNIRFLNSIVIGRRGFSLVRCDYHDIFEQTAKMDIMV